MPQETDRWSVRLEEEFGHADLTAELVSLVNRAAISRHACV